MLSNVTASRRNLSFQCWLPLMLFTPSTGWAAAAASQPESMWWNVVLLLIVFGAAAGSAVLPISAFRYWTGYWKLVAALPLLLLAGWVSWIVIARLLDSAAHQYWMLEIFAWAMLAMLYMATVMTAKRQFDKADNPENP